LGEITGEKRKKKIISNFKKTKKRSAIAQSNHNSQLLLMSSSKIGGILSSRATAETLSNQQLNCFQSWWLLFGQPSRFIKSATKRCFPKWMGVCPPKLFEAISVSTVKNFYSRKQFRSSGGWIVDNDEQDGNEDETRLLRE
jgi:hypothetical protein